VLFRSTGLPAQGGDSPVEDASHAASRLLDDVVERAVADIADPSERERVRQSVAEALRDSLLAIAGAVEGPAADGALDGPAPAAASRSVEFGSGAQTGIAVAKQVQQLGFTEFTRSLIDNTFDAVVGAQLRQVEAYAELVADLAKTLAQFQAANVSDADVTAFLAQRFPDGQGGTSVRPGPGPAPGYQFTDTLADPATGAPAVSASDKMQVVIDTLLAEIPGLLTTDVPLDTTTPVHFTADQVKTIRGKVATELARRKRATSQSRSSATWRATGWRASWSPTGRSSPASPSGCPPPTSRRGPRRRTTATT
jgi:hypothetical protein